MRTSACPGVDAPQRVVAGVRHVEVAVGEREPARPAEGRVAAPPVAMAGRARAGRAEHAAVRRRDHDAMVGRIGDGDEAPLGVDGDAARAPQRGRRRRGRRAGRGRLAPPAAGGRLREREADRARDLLGAIVTGHGRDRPPARVEHERRGQAGARRGRARRRRPRRAGSGARRRARPASPRRARARPRARRAARGGRRARRRAAPPRRARAARSRAGRSRRAGRERVDDEDVVRAGAGRVDAGRDEPRPGGEEVVRGRHGPEWCRSRGAARVDRPRSP